MQANHPDFETLTDACFGYLVSDPEELSRFMQFAGYSPDILRRAIGTESLSLAMFDYFASNEKNLTAMCDSANIGTERFMSLWKRLNGSEQGMA